VQLQQKQQERNELQSQQKENLRKNSPEVGVEKSNSSRIIRVTKIYLK
jgi:hypothetical protein